MSVPVRAVAVGTLAGVLTPLAAILLNRIGFYRCMDTPEFLYITPLVEAGIGVALVTVAGTFLGGNARPGTGRAALVIGIAVLGLALLGFALAGAPYHACAQFPNIHLRPPPS